jgi:hypothetical protein
MASSCFGGNSSHDAPSFPSFNKKALVLLLNLSDSLKIFMEEQLMDPWHPFKPPSAGLLFFLNILSKPQVRAVKNKFLACRQRPQTCLLMQLEISPRSGQSPRRSEGGQLVQIFLDYMPSDGQLMRKCLIESMVLQANNLHMGNGIVPYSLFFCSICCRSAPMWG